jgi:hypothetical protein
MTWWLHFEIAPSGIRAAKEKTSFFGCRAPSILFALYADIVSAQDARVAGISAVVRKSVFLGCTNGSTACSSPRD